MRSPAIVPILLCAAVLCLAAGTAEARPASHAVPTVAVVTVVKTKVERTAHRVARKVRHVAHAARTKTAHAFHAAGRNVKHAAHVVHVKAGAEAHALKRKVRRALRS